MKLTRRSVLRYGAGVSAAGLAGCLDSPVDAGGADAEGYTAFFTLQDWSERVAGDRVSFTNPVSVGQMGHGWEPDGDLTRNIASTDAFVYLDIPEFSWAQNVADTLRDDHPEVALIDGMDGFTADELLSFSPVETEADHDHDFDPETLEVGGFDVVSSRSGEVAAYWHVDHWDGGMPDVPLDGSTDVTAVFTDSEDRVVPLGDEKGFTVDAEVTGPDGVVEVEPRGDRVRLHGVETGRTLLVFQLKHEGDVIWDTSEDDITVEVVEEVESEDVGEFHDPHVWVDPVLAQDIVDRIADGLADVEPDGADEFEENAEEYKARMEDVHEGFEAVAADAEREVAVFAGHDSFAYLEDRYSFELHTPVGVTPDAAESFDDVAGMVEVVDEHNIDTVLYDPFESPTGDVPQMVDLILENSDATDHAPLSPAEGTTQEWLDNGWGWVEQMEEINIPSLREALGAD